MSHPPSSQHYHILALPCPNSTSTNAPLRHARLLVRRRTLATPKELHVLHTRQIPFGPATEIVRMAASSIVHFVTHALGNLFVKTTTSLVGGATRPSPVLVECRNVRRRRRFAMDGWALILLLQHPFKKVAHHETIFFGHLSFGHEPFADGPTFHNARRALTRMVLDGRGHDGTGQRVHFVVKTAVAKSIQCFWQILFSHLIFFQGRQKNALFVHDPASEDWLEVKSSF